MPRGPVVPTGSVISRGSVMSRGSGISQGAGTLGRRACALLAACSAALHGFMVGGAGNPVVAVLIVGMALTCLYCAYELWSAGSLRVWCVVAVMNLGMVAVHLSMPSHHHGATVSVTSVVPVSVVPMSALMTVATTISIVEAAVATAVLYVQTRRRAVSLAAQWD